MSLWYPSEPEGLARKALLSPLSAASLAFGAVVRTRNALYDRGQLKAERVEGVRVISIGNITVGGAGKTPVAIYLARRLGKVAVLSRGYGRQSAEVRRVRLEDSPLEVGDEPLLIARRCPEAAVWVGADRVELARRARSEGSQVLLLDDGMQHRRLARDVEIVVLDGLGNGRLMPRGPLREPTSALDRASLLWVTGGDAVAARPTVRARNLVSEIEGPDGERSPLGIWKGRPVFLFAGIARPERFRRSIEQGGAEIIGEAWFPYHHFFTPGELADVRARAGSASIVTTEKDRVRLPAGFEVFTAVLDVQILQGEALIDQLCR